MKLWLSKSGDVPIQEQISTQIILGIVSADLAPGECVPSTAALGRRFKIHPNTVRAAYRELAERGWLEWKRGSGYYVREFAKEPQESQFDLDQLTANFLKNARQRGHSLQEIQARLARWFIIQSPDHILVLEPDAELRAIMIEEIAQSIPMRVEGASQANWSSAPISVGAMCVALYDHADEVRRALPWETSCLFLHSTSIPKRLAKERRPRDMVITVISRWADFLQWARTTLIAVGIDAALLDIRDAREQGWDRGLTSRSFVITDSLLYRQIVSGQVAAGCTPHVFRVIADESMAELKMSLAGL